MLALVVIFSLAVLAVVAAQLKWGNDFVSLYRQDQQPTYDGEMPHVGVILSLRGADPYLEDCLRGLMSLDYAGHEIRIIIDSDVDPAFEIVQRICDQMSAINVTIELLDLCQETSSLKNSALIQGINGCSSQCEAFAWLDSDTVPYPAWLTDLVTPLRSDEVGAACGIRWYAPPNQSIANYVRHLWNSAAVVQMVAFQIGWGGAFAIRKSVIVETNLLSKWARAMTEDTVASDAVLANGKRMAFVAAATMPNSESASLSWCISFVTRQLQVLRYYHRAWTPILLYGIFSTVAVLGCIGATIAAAVEGDLLALGIGAGVLCLFGLTVGWLMRRAEHEIIKRLNGRAIAAPSSIWRLMAAAPITQVVHAIALTRAYLRTTMIWRGIRYRVRSGMDVTRENYAPYVPETDTVKHSL